MSNGNNSYFERVGAGKSYGEVLFELYCQENNCQFQRLGFDENQGNVPNFWRINSVLRNLPDYVINNSKGKTFVVAVKGTQNFKKKEFELLPKMMEAFGSPEAPLIYAFCFENETLPIWLKPEELLELYNQSQDEQWPDKVIYRKLNIRNENERLQYALLDSQKPVRPILQSNDFSEQEFGL